MKLHLDIFGNHQEYDVVFADRIRVGETWYNSIYDFIRQKLIITKAKIQFEEYMRRMR